MIQGAYAVSGVDLAGILGMHERIQWAWLGARGERQIALTSKFNNHGLGQYGAEPHYSTSPFGNFVH